MPRPLSTSDEIGLQEGVADPAAILDQQPPLEHDLLGDGQNRLLEHWPYFMRQPIIQLSAPACVGHQCNAESDFRQRDRADVMAFKRLSRNERNHLRLWPRTPQFR
jgi:hypothetical protein